MKSVDPAEFLPTFELTRSPHFAAQVVSAPRTRKRLNSPAREVDVHTAPGSPAQDKACERLPRASPPRRAMTAPGHQLTTLTPSLTFSGRAPEEEPSRPQGPCENDGCLGEEGEHGEDAHSGLVRIPGVGGRRGS